MPKGRFRVWSAVPAAQNYRAVLDQFAGPGVGIVTSFSDSLLAMLRAEVQNRPEFELRPFGAVVRELLMLSGEYTLGIASDGIFRAAIAEACSRIDGDSPFAASSRFAGTHRAIAKTLHELSGWGINAQALTLASETLATEPYLADKLKSLAWIQEQVDSTLEQLGRQRHGHQLAHAIDGVLDLDGGWNRLLVLARGEVEPIAYKWLRWLADQGIEVTLVVDRHANDGELFDATKVLRGIAEPVAPPRSSNLANRLFTEPSDEPATLDLDVRIESAPDRLHEVEWALRHCATQDNPDACAIFAPDLSEYGPLLEAASTRLGVPIRLIRRMPLMANGFARFATQLLESLAAPRIRDLERVTGSSYLGLTLATRDNLRTAIREASMSREDPWGKLAEWARERNEELPWLLNLLDWRVDAISNDRTVREWDASLQSLFAILASLGTREIPVLYPGERDARAQSAMLRSLHDWMSVEQLVTARGVSLGRFVRHCRQIWADSDVSVPSQDSGILVTSVPERLGSPEVLVVLGMLEGSLPRRRREDPVLGDEDRKLISDALGLTDKLKDSFTQAVESRENFYRVAISASKRLVLSYPRADDDSEGVPSFFLDEVRTAAGSVTEIKRLREDPLPDLLEADRKLRQSLELPTVDPPDNVLMSERASEALRVVDPPVASPEELRDALKCPFQRAARHRLRLWVRQERVRWGRLGRMTSAVRMAELPTEEAMVEALTDAMEIELDRILPDAQVWEMDLLRRVGERMVHSAVRRETSARNIWPRTAGTQTSDVPYGTPDFLSDQTWSGITLKGQVDAMAIVHRLNVAMLYGMSAGDYDEKQADRLAEPEQMYLGLIFAAIQRANGTPAVELDFANGRKFIALQAVRPALSALDSENIKVLHFLSSDASSDDRRGYYEPLKKLVERALTIIRKPEIEPKPGDHCERCDFGELCRRSQLFGESDSPFDFDAMDGENA